MIDGRPNPECNGHPAWDYFVDWCEYNGMNPGGHPDDWVPHWECFAGGWEAHDDNMPWRNDD